MIPHREVGRIDHRIEDIGVVQQGVGIDLFQRRRQGLEQGVVQRDHAAALHEGVVGVHVDHQRRRGARQKAQERGNERIGQRLVEEGLGRRERVEDQGEGQRRGDGHRRIEGGEERVQRVESGEEQRNCGGEGGGDVVADGDGGDEEGVRVEGGDVAGDPGGGGGGGGSDADELVVGDAEEDAEAGVVEGGEEGGVGIVEANVGDLLGPQEGDEVGGGQEVADFCADGDPDEWLLM